MGGIERTMSRRSFSSSRDVVVGIVVAGWEGFAVRGGSFGDYWISFGSVFLGWGIGFGWDAIDDCS